MDGKMQWLSDDSSSKTELSGSYKINTIEHDNGCF